GVHRHPQGAAGDPDPAALQLRHPGGAGRQLRPRRAAGAGRLAVADDRLGGAAGRDMAHPQGRRLATGSARLSSSPTLTVRGAHKRYGAKAAVADASLELRPGRITCLLGPSGCGKSTLLRLIAGLELMDAGEIRAGDRVLSGKGIEVAPVHGGVGMVFQDYALFPHMSVLDNVAFGLAGAPRRERRARALALLEHVRLAPRAGAWPQALSGGEQQRVAPARALAREPAAVLLDEPFSGLAGALKAEVRA